jgi:hypothetical protein
VGSGKVLKRYESVFAGSVELYNISVIFWVFTVINLNFL